MDCTRIAPGMYYVDTGEAGLRILCGCPENAIKHAFKAGAVRKAHMDGQAYEIGPNAIILSELPVQRGRFANVAEFPVLHMLYRQGMIVPGHPGNTGEKPLLVGLPDQIRAQADYIYQGNYGITDPEELAPGDPELADYFLRVKRWFAFGRFKPSPEILELRELDGHVVELRRGVFLRRLGVNRYELIYKGETAQVDLNLGPGELYACPYELKAAPALRDGFSVIHLGEGDGWDPDRPCMSSIVMGGGYAYLVDAGPHVDASLDAVGLAPACLRGVFLTHTHDDHFVGLTALMRSERRLELLAAGPVLRAAQKKLEALSGLGSQAFGRLFELKELIAGAWNEVEGLLVRPDYSPHPLETTVMRFKPALQGGEAYVYAHYADLSSFAVIDAMSATTSQLPAGLTQAEAASAKELYLEAASLKKLDVGGGQIHGSAADFVGDASGELLWSHGIRPERAAKLGRGRVAGFGERTSYLPLPEGWVRRRAFEALRAFFPSVPADGLESLLDSPLVSLEPGQALCRRGEAVQTVYLSVSGRLERADSPGGKYRSLRPGALVNALDCARGAPSSLSFAAAEATELYAVPAAAFGAFVARYGLGEDLERVNAVALRLAANPIFQELEFLPGFISLCRAASELRLAPGQELDTGGGYAVVAAGRLAVFGGAELVEFEAAGGGFGEESLWEPKAPRRFRARAMEGSVVMLLPAAALEDKPLVLWRLREAYQRRLASQSHALAFRWRPEYRLGLDDIDQAHNAIFLAIEAALESNEGFDQALARASAHFKEEEAMMARLGYPGLEDHRAEHGAYLEAVRSAQAGLDSGEGRERLAHGLKDALIRHTLLADRRYLPWARGEDPS